MSEWERRLIEAADRLRQVEVAYQQAVTALREAKQNCAIKESELISANKVNMKNEDTRNADFWKHAKEERKAVIAKEAKLDSLKGELHYRQHLFDAVCLCAKFELLEREQHGFPIQNNRLGITYPTG